MSTTVDICYNESEAQRQRAKGNGRLPPRRWSRCWLEMVVRWWRENPHRTTNPLAVLGWRRECRSAIFRVLGDVTTCRGHVSRRHQESAEGTVRLLPSRQSRWWMQYRAGGTTCPTALTTFRECGAGGDGAPPYSRPARWCNEIAHRGHPSQSVRMTLAIERQTCDAGSKPDHRPNAWWLASP